jgi:hypothetical protein
MLAIFWILIVPNVDLDPAPPLNLEAFFFAVIAIGIILRECELGSEVLQRSTLSVLHLPPPLRTCLFAEISPLRC